MYRDSAGPAMLWASGQNGAAAKRLKERARRQNGMACLANGHRQLKEGI